jgi:transcriptional regulator GlxA family with amidase domain
MKAQNKKETAQLEEAQQLAELSPFTVNEVSLASATGLDPSSHLVKYFAKTFPEPEPNPDVN